MIILNISEKASTLVKDKSKDKSKDKESVPDPINVFCQFFIPKTPDRLEEIQQCLRFNIDNPFVSTVYLLNERIYTNEEMGVTDSTKIVQYNLGRRLRFSDVFTYIDVNAIKGYNVILNSDIFVDKTIDKLRNSDLSVTKKMIALLRFEYDPTNIVKSKIFGPRLDSQDTWILHSDFNVKADHRKVFEFEFGKPGCDNKMIYLMNILGYEVVNDPTFIKTYHIHKSQARDYTIKDRVPNPYALLAPYGYSLEKVTPSLGVDLVTLSTQTKNFSEIRFDDNNMLHDYIKNKLSKGQKFIIPRIAGVENNFAVNAEISKNNGRVDQQVGEYFNKNVATMKKNAGICLTTMESINLYSDLYMRSFDNSELIGAWELHGRVYSFIKQSHDYIRKKYKSRKFFWAFAFDIFHYIHSVPWTHALRGKRILIISAFEHSVLESLPNREQIYGVDLFPECKITTIRPPQTQGAETSQEFNIELANFCKKLDLIKDTYDVALVSCGGYGNLVCNHIYSQNGKSAIYVGGVLQMYFGILGDRWVRERPDIVKLYVNKFWKRPNNSEKPLDYQSVENACYW